MTSIQKYRKPEQLVLDFFFQDEDTQKYSQSIELYDALPKYFWGKAPRVTLNILFDGEMPKFEHA
jgi:hypothetical protein